MCVCAYFVHTYIHSVLKNASILRIEKCYKNNQFLNMLVFYLFIYIVFSLLRIKTLKKPVAFLLSFLYACNPLDAFQKIKLPAGNGHFVTFETK